MPCYDGVPPDSSIRQLIETQANTILCSVCRGMQASGHLGSDHELKSWFIKHLASDVLEARECEQAEADKRLLLELINGNELPYKIVLGGSNHGGEIGMIVNVDPLTREVTVKKL